MVPPIPVVLLPAVRLKLKIRTRIFGSLQFWHTVAMYFTLAAESETAEIGGAKIVDASQSDAYTRKF